MPASSAGADVPFRLTPDRHPLASTHRRRPRLPIRCLLWQAARARSCWLHRSPAPASNGLSDRAPQRQTLPAAERAVLRERMQLGLCIVHAIGATQHLGREGSRRRSRCGSRRCGAARQPSRKIGGPSGPCHVNMPTPTRLPRKCQAFSAVGGSATPSRSAPRRYGWSTRGISPGPRRPR